MINYHWLEKSDISVTSRQTTILWSRKISKLLGPWRLKVLPEAKAAPPHWPSCTSCSKTNHNTQVGRSSHRFIHSSNLWKLLPNFGNDVATSVRHLLRQTKTLQLLSAFCFCCFSVPTSGRRIEGRSITDLTNLNEEIAWSTIGARLYGRLNIRYVIIDHNVECHKKDWKWYRGQTQKTNNL